MRGGKRQSWRGNERDRISGGGLKGIETLREGEGE